MAEQKKDTITAILSNGLIRNKKLLKAGVEIEFHIDAYKEIKKDHGDMIKPVGKEPK